MQATMSAPRVNPQPGHAVAQAPQKPAITPQEAATRLVQVYAEVVLKNLYSMIGNENDVCQAQGLSGKEVSTTKLTFPDGSIKVLKLRDLKLHQENADLEIDRKIGNLSDADKKVLNLIGQKADGLITNHVRDTLRSIQLISVNAKQPLDSIQLIQSMIFKTHLYAAVAKIQQAHKALIVANLK
ncbi:MAG: hypothetical protein JSS12_10225 [Verrucomicrobia bacterium]|nr:hypothetical protein [Verrucomicrobiota bacterium]